MLLHRKLHIVVDGKYQQTSSGTENGAVNTVMAIPAAFTILYNHQFTGGGILTFFSAVTTLHQQALTRHQEAHELFSAVISKT